MELGFVYFPLKFQSCDFFCFYCSFLDSNRNRSFLPLFKVTVTAEADCFTFSLMLFTFNLMVGVSLLPTVRVCTVPLLPVRFWIFGANTVACETVVHAPKVSVGVGVTGFSVRCIISV